MLASMANGYGKTAALASGFAACLLMTTSAAAMDAAQNMAKSPPVTSGTALEKLKDAVNGGHRAADRKARDTYRHPVETLSFFGIQPNMTVVELWPFGGWYTEIIAPYVKGSGTYYAAMTDPKSTRQGDINYNASFKKLLDARPDLYGEVKWTVLAPGKIEIAPDGSADLVLTFRNIHNWAWSGIDKDVWAAAFRALKPGGVLGVVEHRNSDPNYEPTVRGNAYMGESWTVKQIEAAGFKLAGRSEVNANPKDTKDYPKGVWTLPPNYAEGDNDRAKYAAIGESDRYTLKFVKPAK
jgi:predicted methyltransferase